MPSKYSDLYHIHLRSIVYIDVRFVWETTRLTDMSQPKSWALDLIPMVFCSIFNGVSHETSTIFLPLHSILLLDNLRHIYVIVFSQILQPPGVERCALGLKMSTMEKHNLPKKQDINPGPLGLQPDAISTQSWRVFYKIE